MCLIASNENLGVVRSIVCGRAEGQSQTASFERRGGGVRVLLRCPAAAFDDIAMSSSAALD